MLMTLFLLLLLFVIACNLTWVGLEVEQQESKQKGVNRLFKCLLIQSNYYTMLNILSFFSPFKFQIHQYTLNKRKKESYWFNHKKSRFIFLHRIYWIDFCYYYDSFFIISSIFDPTKPFKWKITVLLRFVIFVWTIYGVLSQKKTNYVLRRHIFS